MRAAWYEKQGPASEVLQLGNLPTPEPEQGEVRVKLSFSGVNPSDTKRRLGFGGQKMAYPAIVPHSDGSGVIDQVGTGVPKNRIGERVWIYCGQWERAHGTAADYISIRENHAIHLPDNIELMSGACLGIPAVTAHRALFSDGPIKGLTVLVTGGAGAVGNYTIQLAKWGGAERVITTCSSPEKENQAKAAGADLVINYKEEDVSAKIMDATDGQGVDRIVEVAFGANLPSTVALLKDNGIISAYASDIEPTPILPFYPMMQKNCMLRWVFMYKIPEDDFANACNDLNNWLKKSSTHHMVSKIFPLEEIAEAHKFLESGEATGNVIISIDGEN